MKKTHINSIITGEKTVGIPFRHILACPFVLILLILQGNKISAQLFDEAHLQRYDTNYVSIYKDELTTRVFLSHKQNSYNLSESLYSQWLQYRTSGQYQIGIGYTYSFLTLNLAIELPFVYKDSEKYGDSRYLNMDVRTDFRNMMVNIYLQWTRGYYLSNYNDFPDLAGAYTGFPVRNDIRTSIIGINIQHLFKSERYSHKASFLQNQFQKRSAGSPVLGFEAYWMLGMADSIIIPSSLDRFNFAGGVDFNQADIISAGLNAGYSHTFVIRERLYLSLSSAWGIAAGTCILNNTATSELNRSGLTMGVTNHNQVSMGYNRNSFYTGISLTNFNIHQNFSFKNGWFKYSTTNIRLSVVKRFKLHRPIRILRPDLWIF